MYNMNQSMNLIFTIHVSSIIIAYCPLYSLPIGLDTVGIHIDDYIKLPFIKPQDI